MSLRTFTATGDSFITQSLPHDTAQFQAIADVIRRGEVRFTNLETVIRQEDGFPSAQSGGTWASSPPEVLEDIRAYGFNLLSCANNHALDYAYGGLESTVKSLDEAGFVHAGIGRNLAEAGAIRYLDGVAGRTALIAATSSFHDSWIAGAERKGPGRPGVNPLRHSGVYQVPPQDFQQLRRIAEKCGINRARDQRVRQGFDLADADGIVRLGANLFREAKPGQEGWNTAPHRQDLARILQAIREAAMKADTVLVSIHTHESPPGQNERPPGFMVTFAHACIDAGAHAVIGHGPHLLRGIEVYRDRPIFYSLGNFLFQNEGVTWLPADFYEQYGLDETVSLEDAFRRRSGNGTRGLEKEPSIWRSAIAEWTMEEGRLNELVLHPLAIGCGEPAEQRGIPTLSSDPALLDEVCELSREFGTMFERFGETAVWRHSN